MQRNSTQEKAKLVRLFILDVDGVLTNGIIYYANSDLDHLKGFHVHDGMGIKLLQRANIEVAVISAKCSKAVEKRLHELDINHIYLGHENKVPIYEQLKDSLQLKPHEIAYMGDDFPDLPLLNRVGFAITVPSAPAILHQHAHLITHKKAGRGAVREACDFILHAQDRYQSVIQSYLST